MDRIASAEGSSTATVANHDEADSAGHLEKAMADLESLRQRVRTAQMALNEEEARGEFLAGHKRDL